MNNQSIWNLSERSKFRQRRRAEVTRNLLDAKCSDLVLDVGCSEGFVDSFLVKGGGMFIGIDTDLKSILMAKSKVKSPNIHFVLADIVSLPFRGNCFNEVALLEVLEHLPRETQKIGISEVDRVLKWEGILVISVPYKEQITYTRCVHCGKLMPLWGHLHYKDEEKVTNLLPSHYTLSAHCHLPNVGLISLANIFQRLPLRLWLVLNTMLGKFRKGYWLLLKYKKGMS